MRHTLKFLKAAKWAEMNAQEKRLTLTNMESGGSFSASIADALSVADSANETKLVELFEDLIERFQPEAAKVEIQVVAEKIGSILHGSGDRDEYIHLKVADEASSQEVRNCLLKAFYRDCGDEAGAYFCNRVDCIETPNANEFIGIVHHQYNT